MERPNPEDYNLTSKDEVIRFINDQDSYIDFLEFKEIANLKQFADLIHGKC
jgi:hypothetical protein